MTDTKLSSVVVGDVLSAITKAQSELQQTAANFFSAMERVRASIAPVIPQIPSVLYKIGEVIRAYPESLHKSLTALALQGWYLDSEWLISEPFQLSSDIDEGRFDDVDATLVAHFTAQLERIEQSLGIEHPKRAHVISRAFKAHRDGDYLVSIPLLLIQADGIAQDFGRRTAYFQSKDDRDALGPVTSIDEAYEKVLSSFKPITYWPDQRGPGFNALNRHRVLHGEDVAYASEKHSLQAVSWLNFVSHALSLGSKESASLDNG